MFKNSSTLYIYTNKPNNNFTDGRQSGMHRGVGGSTARGRISGAGRAQGACIARRAGEAARAHPPAPFVIKKPRFRW